MKQVISFAVCLLICGTIHAQYPIEHKKKQDAHEHSVAVKQTKADADKKPVATKQTKADADNKKPVAVIHKNAAVTNKPVAVKHKKNDPAVKKAMATEHKKNHAAPKDAVETHGRAIGGFIHDDRKHPLAGVEAFIYKSDSSIIASGYTDAMGHYETNPVAPGKYDLKIVYPTSKVILVKDIPVNTGVTQLSLNTNPPDADTTLLYADLMPKAEAKKKTK